MPLSAQRRIEPRVSETTLDRMRFMTGAIGDIRDARFQIVVDGIPYEIAFDEHGKATIIGHRCQVPAR